MAELRIPTQDELKENPNPLAELDNYKKALRFADDSLRTVLTEADEYIHQRNLQTAYDNAKQQMETASNELEFNHVAELFSSISGFEDANVLQEECLRRAEGCKKDEIYNSSKRKMSAGKYKEAIEEFSSVSGWKDADEQAAICKKKIAKQKEVWKKKIKILIPILSAVVILIILFVKLAVPKIERNNALNQAMALIESGDYDAGYAILEELGENETIQSNKYDRAIKLIDSGDYRAAYVLLSGLAYKDSAEKLQSIKPLLLAKANHPGDTVFFGKYEQDKDISNGKEDIAWLVLAKENNKIFVISEKALDCQPYNIEQYANVTWETCTLRKWLNTDFINSAFSSDEKAKISTVTVSADKNPKYGTDPGNATQDQVFLLSITEANKYFDYDNIKTCRLTDYAATKTSTGWYWWLRSPGDYHGLAAYVNFDGSVSNDGYIVSNSSVAVRPAMWISIK